MMKYQKKRTKYGSKKTICNSGHLHASKKEAKRCNELVLLEKTGKIRWLKQQPVFTLQPKFRWRGKGIRAITYIADFSYFDTKSKIFIVEDTKGYKTEKYQIKKKLLIFMMRDRQDFLFLES
jgi:hypothetical protein